MSASARPIATTRSTAGMPTGRLAVWWVIASEIVIFGGLLGSYIMFRLSHDSFASEAANTNMYIGAFNTWVLLTSSLFAVLGHKAAEEGDGREGRADALPDLRRRPDLPAASRAGSGPRRSRTGTRSARAPSSRSTTRRRACTRCT